MNKQFLLLLSFFGIALFSSCTKDKCKEVRTILNYEPVLKTAEQIRSEFSVDPPRDIKEMGRLFVHGEYILINEIHKGIHIIDNSTPEAPKPLSFLNIPGNVDMAMKDDILYADDYLDILVIDLSNIIEPKLLCRNNNIFSNLYKTNEGLYVTSFKEVIVDLEVDCDYIELDYFKCGDAHVSKETFRGSGKSSGTGAFKPNANLNGSLARFTTYGNFLYCINGPNVNTFDVANECPILTSTVNCSWDIQTLYPYQNNLFIGSASGLFIYSLGNPAFPLYAGKMQHIRSCDPVVVSGDIAYVTLKGGSACGGFTNQLDIVDVKNIFQPTLLKSYPMTAPVGLGTYEDLLYICDDGIKVFDVKNIYDIKLVEHLKHESSNDLILDPDRNLLLEVANDFLAQYRTETIGNTRLISKINVKK